VTELPLFPAPSLRPAPPPAEEPGPVRCEEPGCGRPIWAEASIRAGPDGRKRGKECRRRYNAARRRARISIADRPAWAVPGQTEIPMPDQEEPCP
jgi:hypothetical protein